MNCKHCNKELSVFLQPNYKAVNDELIELEPLTMVTCMNEKCGTYGATLNKERHDALSPEELERYSQAHVYIKKEQ